MAADETSHSDPDECDWDHASFVISSRYRTAVMARLEAGPATPSAVADDEDVRLTHVSRALNELRDRGLVDLLVSDDRKKGRVYGMTDDGRDANALVDDATGGDV